MRAFFNRDCETRWCQHSHLVTRETPSIVVVFHPVSSQVVQVTRHGNSDRASTNMSACAETVRSDDRTVRRTSPEHVTCSERRVARRLPLFRAMQRYGLIVADNGSDMYWSVVP